MGSGITHVDVVSGRPQHRYNPRLEVATTCGALEERNPRLDDYEVIMTVKVQVRADSEKDARLQVASSTSNWDDWDVAPFTTPLVRKMHNAYGSD